MKFQITKNKVTLLKTSREGENRKEQNITKLNNLGHLQKQED